MNAELENREHVAARMGVGTGEVVVADAADPRHRRRGRGACRLGPAGGTGGAGEVLLSAATETLVREAVVAERLELRGGGGERAFAVRSLVEGAEAIPRKVEGLTVGRDREIDQLRDVFERAVEKQRSALVTVPGPAWHREVAPGVGVLGGRRGRGARARGSLRPPTVRARHSYRCWTSSTSWAAMSRSRRSWSCWAAASAATWPRARSRVPWASARAPATRPAGRLASSFEALAEQGPTVVVFEDIHWAEPPLLDLIEQLADEVRDLPLVLICLSRAELLDERPTWRAVCPTRRRSRSIR